MRFPKIQMDAPRLWFNLLIIILFILLYIFPKPVGLIFNIARIIVAIGVGFALFWANGKNQWAIKKLKTETGPLKRAEMFTGNHSLGQSRHYYDQLLMDVFNIIQSLNEDFESAVYMIDPMSNGYTLQNATDDQFIDFVNMDNELIQTLIKQDECLFFQQKDLGAAWNALLQSNDWNGSECLLGIRIIYRGAAVGCLLVYTDHFNKLARRDREIITGLGVFVSKGIEKLERIEELISDRENYSRITDLLSLQEISAPKNDIFESIRKLCRSLYTYDKLTISIQSLPDRNAIIQLVDGFIEDINVKDEFPVDGTLHGRPMRTGKSIRSSYWETDYNDSGRFTKNDNEQYNFMAVVGVPLKIGSDYRGAIVMERLSSRGYTESDLWLLEALAQTLNTILAWSDNYQIMHQHATHDGLTELLNHKSFLERFEEEISRSLRFQQDLVLLMMDLDKFKRINDNYGHLYGDYVLKKVSQTLKTCIRNIDVIGRYGGEEFAILLINTNKYKAKAVAQRIVKSISDYQFRNDDIDVRMTISIGLAQFPEDADRIKDLIGRADVAMYRVKGQGGNGVLEHDASSN
ncbi:MAG: GGDEF domain-containing protein [Candidatus Marinimicrobia bacterium]|nr:GGDEF domain-containing protein [Candidatus Neomarinimicrobiota bacterium]